MELIPPRGEAVGRGKDQSGSVEVGEVGGVGISWEGIPGRVNGTCQGAHETRQPQGLCGGSRQRYGELGLWEELALDQPLKGFLCPLQELGLLQHGRKDNPSHLLRVRYLLGAVSSVLSADCQRPCKALDLSLPCVATGDPVGQ